MHTKHCLHFNHSWTRLAKAKTRKDYFYSPGYSHHTWIPLVTGQWRAKSYARQTHHSASDSWQASPETCEVVLFCCGLWLVLGSSPVSKATHTPLIDIISSNTQPFGLLFPPPPPHSLRQIACWPLSWNSQTLHDHGQKCHFPQTFQDHCQKCHISQTFQDPGQKWHISQTVQDPGQKWHISQTVQDHGQKWHISQTIKDHGQKCMHTD